MPLQVTGPHGCRQASEENAISYPVNLPIASKIMVALGFMLLLSLGSGGVFALRLHEVHEAGDDASANRLPSIRELGYLRFAVARHRTLIGRHVSISEMRAATAEIARSVRQGAAGTSEVHSDLAGGTKAANDTAIVAAMLNAGAAELAKQAEALEREVDGVLTDLRAA